MKISLPAWIFLLAFLAQCIIPVWSSRCPTVRLRNGKVRARARGRIIRFMCYEGFTLVGNKYSTCFEGQWVTPTPVCVNAECPAPPVPEHALVAPKYNGAILIYFCEPGYALIGPPEIFCDGMQWNGTTPHCRDTRATAPTQCDFEKPDLCWWEQDPLHDFDWRRHNFQTPSYHIGTGPTHDHTLGPGNDGYYLYIEASGRLVNDTARIMSPIYNASYTESGCFSFWYHMFGATIGALNVYFKRETENTSLLMFSKEGDQGNQWLHGIFDLPKAEKGFQIIIEGVRGSSYVSDIAIDDVAILQGEQCRNASKTENDGVTDGDKDQIERVNAQLSCRGRCKNSVTSNFMTTMPSTLSDTCLCTLNCAEHSMCCPDYAEYCILGYTEDLTTATEQSTIPNHEAPASLPPARKDPVTDVATVRTGFYDGKGISINPKDDIDPVTSKPTTNGTAKPVATPSRTEKPTGNTRRTATPPVTTIPRIEKSTRTTRRTNPLPVTTTASTARPTGTTKTTSKIVQTKETPFAKPTTVPARRYERVDEQPDPKVTRPEPEISHRSPTTFRIIGVIVGILTGVSISLMVVIIILRRRRTFKRGSNGSALSEDSDVRFLTSDEILDFTLARPNDHEET